MARTKQNIVRFKAYESQNPTGIEKNYLRIAQSLYYSNAYRRLNYSARDIYVDMRMEAKGSNEVIYTEKRCCDRLECSHATYEKAIKQLIEFGFIERTGRRGNWMPSKFRFVDKWKSIPKKIKSSEVFTLESQPIL